MDITLQEDRDKEPFLINDFGDRYLYSLNHNTLNSLGATQIHLHKYSTHCATKNTLFIIIGTDSGTLLPFLADKKIAAGTQFILLEPSISFERIAAEYASVQLSPHIHFGSAEHFNDLASTAGLGRYFYAGEVVIIKSLAAEYGFITEYHELFITVQDKCRQQQWQMNLRLQSQPFVHAQLRNLADNTIPSTLLKDSFAGKTAVLLAGGPSLDDALPWVSAHRNLVVVLAVSRICRRLLEVDLQPDFIFSIDPHEVSFEVSVEMLHLWQDSVFINAYHVSPRLLGQWRGNNIFIGHRFPWNSPLNEQSLPMSGPTVSNVALAVATEMEFKQVILAGLDLCHSKNGFTHAQGSNERQAGPQLASNSVQVLTNGGWMAETTSDFFSAIDTISLQAQHGLKKGVAIINPAEGAARIDGVQHLPFKEIRLIDDAQTSAPPLSLPLQGSAQREKDFHQVLKELARAKGQLIHILKLTQEALRCNEGLFGRKGKKQDFSYKLKMDKIEKTLNKKYSDLSTLVKQYAAYDLLQMTKLGDEDGEWSDEEIEKSAEIYYQNYNKAAKKIIEQVDIAKQSILNRLEEDKQHPDLARLLLQWEKDNQPGRLFIFLDRHALTLQEKTTFHDQISRLEKQYACQFTNASNSSHMKRSVDWASLQGVRGKMQRYLQEKDRQALHNLETSLQQHPDPQASKYFHLCSGMVAEIDGETDKALAAYQQLFEEQDEVFVENALQRILTISLMRNDYENSETALEILTRISPSYLVQYGDLLRLLGQSQKALAAYIDYLEIAPQDISSMLKAADYFKELNIKEGASEMYQHVLQQDPNNLTARRMLNELHSTAVSSHN